MSLYQTLLFFHILGAIVWVGGAVMIQALGIQARGEGPEQVAGVLGSVGKLSNVLLIPAALVVVIAGVAMVLHLDRYEFSQVWIAAALVMFIASFLTGALFLGPESKRIHAIIEERGPADADAQRRIGRIFLISRIELVALVAIVLLMVWRPGS